MNVKYLLLITVLVLPLALAEPRQLFLPTEIQDGRRLMAAAAAAAGGEHAPDKVLELSLLEQYKVVSNQENSVEKVAQILGFNARQAVDDIIYPIAMQKDTVALFEEDGATGVEEWMEQVFINNTVMKAPIPTEHIANILSHYGALEKIAMSDIREFYEYCDDETSAIAQLYHVMDKVIQTLPPKIQEELKTIALYDKGVELARREDPSKDKDTENTVQSLYHGVRLFRGIMDAMVASLCDVKNLLTVMEEDPVYAVILEHNRSIKREFSLEEFLRNSKEFLFDELKWGIP